MKHKLKNIANRPIPVEGMKLTPGQIVEAEMTPKLKNMIQNKFFKDLGVVFERPKMEAKKEEKAEEPIDEEVMLKKKRGRKSKYSMEDE